MGDEICVGRKEIVAFFQELKLISSTTSPKDGWLTVLRWRKKYGMSYLFHRHPNGKPKIIKREIFLWLTKTSELSRRMEQNCQ